MVLQSLYTARGAIVNFVCGFSVLHIKLSVQLISNVTDAPGQFKIAGVISNLLQLNSVVI